MKISCLSLLIVFTMLYVSPVYADIQKVEEPDSAPDINIKFIYTVCNDIDEMRHFYSDIVGMEEYSYMNDEEWGWLAYSCDGFDFMVFRADEEVDVIDDFTWIPGPGGGPYWGVAWSVEITEDKFDAVVEALQAEDTPSLTEDPEWAMESYWSYTVRDPMGNTVEIYYSPEQIDE